MVKICKNCSIEKDIELFHKHPGWKDGRYSICSECRNNHKKKSDTQYRNINKQKCNQRIAGWAQKNPEKIRAKYARRRAQKLNACPSWTDHKAIEAIYAEARRLTRETGILHHVDHIYPLISPYVCGLHVVENLQILTKSENLSKGNNL